jgi:hypothetical protein
MISFSELERTVEKTAMADFKVMFNDLKGHREEENKNNFQNCQHLD